MLANASVARDNNKVKQWSINKEMDRVQLASQTKRYDQTAAAE